MKTKQSPLVRYKNIMILIFFGLLLITVVPRLHSFSSSLTIVGQARPGWVLLGIVTVVFSYAAAALTYVILAAKRLNYRHAFIVQLATMLTNRLLPAGTGAAGLNYDYLRRAGHKPAVAASIVGLNSLLGLVGHASLFVIAILLYGDSERLDLQLSSRQVWTAALIATLALTAIGGLIVYKKAAIRSFWSQCVTQLRSYRRRPWRLPAALLSSLGVTAAYTLTLFATTRALGVTLSPAEVFFVLTAGVAGAAVTPTPGGIGGAEAGIAAVLVLYDVNATTALAVAVLYRLLTFWLPLLAGIFGFWYGRRQKYI